MRSRPSPIRARKICAPGARDIAKIGFISGRRAGGGHDENNKTPVCSRLAAQEARRTPGQLMLPVAQVDEIALVGDADRQGREPAL